MLNLVTEGEEDYIEAIRYRRRLKIFENFLFFFRFVGQLLEHPVWRHLPLLAHQFFKFYGKFENRVHLNLNLQDHFLASI